MTWAIALLIIAIVLVILELTIPSFGLLGLGAATAFVFSLVKAFDAGSSEGWTTLGVGVIMMPIAIGIGLKLVTKSPLSRRLFLTVPEKGLTPAPEQKVRVGDLGMTQTDLRPSGSAEFNGHRVDVTTEGSYISRGRAVVVLALAGPRCIVQESPIASPSVESPIKEQGTSR